MHLLQPPGAPRPNPRLIHCGRRACLGLLLLLATPLIRAEGKPSSAPSSTTPPPTSASSPATSPAPTTLPANLPLRRDSGSGLGSDGSTALRAFSLVVLLLALAYWALRQVQKAKTGTSTPRAPWRKWLAPGEVEGMRMVQSSRLTPKASVHLLQWDGKEWMVGVTDQSISLLGQRPLDGQATEKVASEEAP